MYIRGSIVGAVALFSRVEAQHWRGGKLPSRIFDLSLQPLPKRTA
jgi:hypothetical protein